MAYHLIGVYDGFDSIAEVKRYYRRCRKPQNFILEDKWIRNNDPVCAHCGKKFSAHSPIANAGMPREMQYAYSETDRLANRCIYFPDTRKVAVMAYVCAWESVLSAIFNQTARLY